MDVYRNCHSNHHFFIQVPLRVSLFLFHGVLTSSLASFYAKKPVRKKVEMLVAKAVRGLAPAVTGQGDLGEGRRLGLELVRSATLKGL